MKRPYLSTSLADLASLCERTQDARVLKQIKAELAKRKTQGARRLETVIDQKLGKTSPSPDLFEHHATRAPPTSRLAPTRKTAKSQVRRRAIPRKPKHSPTEEQMASINAFMSGENLKITAFAGAGKTSTLVQMADLREGTGLYLAFNRAIADEAKSEFLPSVDCRTTHSVALRSVRAAGTYQKDKLFTVIKPKQLAKVLELKNRVISGTLSLSDVQQAHLFASTVRQFCQSADDDLAEHHVLRSGRLMGLEDAQQAEIVAWTANEARRLWSRMIDPRDAMPLGHDGYLKLWSLSDSILDYDYVLMDEAQDTNPAVMRVLERQKGQIVYVGDQHQQIYAWRGAVNAMAEAQTPNATYLTQSFRFGPAIAAAASSLLRMLGETKSVRGNPRVDSKISNFGPARTVLCRTNSMVISEVLEALERGQKPHIIGGTDETLKLVGSVYELMSNQPAAHPDFFGFTSWDQAIAFSETDEGEDLRPFVGLVRKYGHRGLYRALKQTAADETDADIVLSTAHKAKGRQWASVRIADDFGGVQSESGAIPVEETRLFYVAITRAQESLIVFDEILEGFQRGRLPPQTVTQAFVPKKPIPSLRSATPPAPPSWSRRNFPSQPVVTPSEVTSPMQISEKAAADGLPVAKKKGFFARLFGS